MPRRRDRASARRSVVRHQQSGRPQQTPLTVAGRSRRASNPHLRSLIGLEGSRSIPGAADVPASFPGIFVDDCSVTLRCEAATASPGGLYRHVGAASGASFANSRAAAGEAENKSEGLGSIRALRRREQVEFGSGRLRRWSMVVASPPRKVALEECGWLTRYLSGSASGGEPSNQTR